jgi:membrane-associated phospholipid phosphatase
MAQQEVSFAKWTYGLAVLPLLVLLLDVTNAQDQTWFLTVNHWAAKFPDVLWTSLSLLGNGWSLFAICFPLLLISRRVLYAGVIAGIFTAILSSVSKSFYSTLRPAGVIDQQLFHIIDSPLIHNAMPSGHTMTAFSIATAIFFSIPHTKRKPYLGLFILAAATGLSRIAVGAHWPEDVLVGATFGIFAGLLGTRLSNSIATPYLELKAWPSYVVMLASLFCFYLLTMDTLDFALNRYGQWLLSGVIVLTWMKLFLVLKPAPRAK